ncbi:MAG: LytTR family DNA-binding domain-containing protein [Firmicutes bacterium]|nr:LytTR family DNA-binding domain-containing protein [Bacillota bacterium]
MKKQRGDGLQITVGVCDDNSLVCESICKKILEVRPNYQIDTYLRGEEILSSKKEYNIIFLDIEMPGKDGMCIAKELRQRNYTGHIIFLTSHTDFMPEAFKVKAFRFLIKPIQQQKLQEALIESEQEIKKEKRRIVVDYGKNVLIYDSDIVYIEAQRNRTLLHTEKEILETNETLKYWEQELSIDDFLKVHKSYLVSLRYIRIVDSDGIILYGTEEKIPVSRRNMVLVKKAFYAYIKDHVKVL